MTFVIGVCVAVTFAVSIYLLLGRDLKCVAMGVFLLGHAANLSIIASSGSPITSVDGEATLKTPSLGKGGLPGNPLDVMADPLPQALILTAIVIGFAVMGFLLTLLVVTARSTKTLELEDLAKDPSALSAEDAA